MHVFLQKVQHASFTTSATTALAPVAHVGDHRSASPARRVNGEGDDEGARIRTEAAEPGRRLVKAAQHQMRVDGRLRTAAG